jgi:hypothetical protein
LGWVRIREWKWEGEGRDQKTPSRAVSPVFKGVSSKKGSKGGIKKLPPVLYPQCLKGFQAKKGVREGDF